MAQVEDMQGKLLLNVTGMEPGSEEVLFSFADETQYKLLHYPDCCEYVRIVDVTGDPSDLIGQVLTLARIDESPEYDYSSSDGSGTWTFYTFGSVKGTVQLRWLGESKGYYSEAVFFARMPKRVKRVKKARTT